jgi:Bacteriophage tail sheath protein
MPEYLAPGVYVEEIDTGSKPIEGVSTSTAGMLGVTERGPVNVPILITSFGEYVRWFGERLNIKDFSNGNDHHCYLPHAVEGFFVNGGKRVYITRVLDVDAAVHAAAFLFDRGAATSALTQILRAAGELTGTAANPPLLYVLDASDLNVNDWIRLGDGSPAEYRQVAAIGTPVNNTHVPLGFPLSRPHNGGDSIEQFEYAPDVGGGATFTAGFTIVLPPNVKSTQRGDQSIVVTGAVADIAALAVNQLLEIGVADRGEYRFIKSVTVTASTEARIQLDSGLLRTYNSGAAVTPLQMTLPVALSNFIAALDLAASVGNGLLFADNRHDEFDMRNALVVIDSADVEAREVRRIGELSRFTISIGAYEDYPAGALVEGVTLQDNERAIVTAAPMIGDLTITLDDITSLSAGQRVQIGADAGPLKETRIIQVITPDPVLANAPRGTLRFTAALTNAHAIGDPVIPLAKSLTAAVTAGGNVIALDNRLGLAVGDVLRLGSAPNEEFVTIQAIPNPSPGGIAPNAGNVILTPPVNRDHALGAPVRRQDRPALAAIQSTILALEANAGNAELLVTDGNAYAANGFIRITTFSNEVFYHRLVVAPAVVTPVEVTLATALERTHATGSAIVGRNPMSSIQALDTGAWGNRLRVSIEDEPTGLVSNTTLNNFTPPNIIRLASAAGVEAGAILELLDPLNDNAVVGEPLKVISVDRAANFAIKLASGLTAAQQAAEAAAVAVGKHLNVRSREFRLSVYLLRQPDQAVPSRNQTILDSEVFRQLSMDPRHSRYVHKIIGDLNGPLRLFDRRPEGESRYVRVHDLAQDLVEPARTTALESVRLGPEALSDILPDGRQRPARQELNGGDDSIATITDDIYIGQDDPNPEGRTGLFSFRNEDDISIVACPGRTNAKLQGALIDQCEAMRYRFAVLDGEPPPNDSIADVQNQRQQFDTKYAAIYHPWLLIPDPYPENLAQIANYSIPPSGHTLGIYARTDIDRGVHKAPANEVVRGVLGLQRLLNKGEQDILNPYPVHINVIRDFRPNNRGIRVFGARCITSDPDWKYVNVRRLLIFIEDSIDRGLQWVVFEPNAEPLWARVTRTISNFLTTVWRNGALEGTKREEAYFVKCDRTTMTQTDIDNGRLIVVIGVAPVKPAEFVIIRIGLWTAHAED